MRITVLGAGAMGMLFGGYLSKENEVWLVDVDREKVEEIAAHGVRVLEPDGDRAFFPRAVDGCAGLPVMDLVITFVKSMYTRKALEANRALIGPDTYIMTLQNGAGHEKTLLDFADAEHTVIGTTRHNSSVIGPAHVHHGGAGLTTIGLLGGKSREAAFIAEAFTRAGLECVWSDDVKSRIWSKLFINTAASSLTAVLQVPMGFILDDPGAHSVMEKLAREAVAVANAEGAGPFEAESVIRDVEELLANGRDGYTSIYADIRDGRRTEVDTISGSVVAAARAHGIDVPCHETVVALIHALERKNSCNPQSK